MGAYDTTVGHTIGLLLIGVFFNTYLYGLVSFRIITYYTSSFNDPLWIRVMVLILLITDTVHSLSLIYLVWVYCVTNFANPAMLLYSYWPYPFTFIGTAVTAFITHLFLGYRIYRFTQLKLLFGFICITAVAILFMGLLSGARALTVHYINQVSFLNALVIYWLSFQTGLDLLIAGIMAFRLYRSHSTYRRTNTVVYRLMGVAIQTGIFCSIFALGDIISFLKLPKSHLYGIFAFPMGRIYTNTVMDILNMREILKDMLYSTEIGAIPSHVQSLSLNFGAPHPVGTTDLEVNQTDAAAGKTKQIVSVPSTNSSILSKPKFESDEQTSI